MTSSVLRLYREMLRSAAQFESYNFRSYLTRRVKEDFRKNKTLAEGSAEQQQALALARQQADALYRQMIVSKLYPPHVKTTERALDLRVKALLLVRKPPLLSFVDSCVQCLDCFLSTCRIVFELF
ncbi:hypothetical protein PHYBOEH_000973 [Phytophthora boehmeriae]|uniref:Complex 1 LYR protein domain-containing protein n=1 Tax=Phytophthora boehmeriae TaxID=109152 RepID=A0A8T1WZY5_9STRA|nr:hypothetical protein PHYBOEH_000973 [Phytophthora boehmeriae]